MRILLVADIHANWPALQAIQEPFDACLFLGDLVDYGLEPSPCIEWVRTNALVGVRGNHDHGVAQLVTVTGKQGFKYLTSVTRGHSVERTSTDDRRFLSSLPVIRRLTLDEMRFFLVHATPRDPMDEFATAAPEYWSRRLSGISADVVCVGHSHLPFVLEVDGKLLVNPGSVGLPRDGDPRASYAIIEGRQVHLHRVEYDVEETIRVIEASALPTTAKVMLAEVYRTGSLGNFATTGVADSLPSRFAAAQSSTV